MKYRPMIRPAAIAKPQRVVPAVKAPSEAAHTPKDLAALPGNRFEALSGNRKGHTAFASNDQWLDSFEWPEKSPGPTNVEIVDYH
jgi:plasmid maintenance system killer protein